MAERGTENDTPFQRYEALARADVTAAVEALTLDAERTLTLGTHERRFWLTKLSNAQNFLEKLRLSRRG